MFLLKSKVFVSSFLSVLVTFAAYAQKADTQITTTLAPNAIKIDGKSTEWANIQFSSNKSTNLTYAIANDDKNLYLVIKSTEAQSNNKIMLGGITLTINTAGKKKEKDGFAVTYPVINRANMRSAFRGQGRQGGLSQTQTTQQRDSMIAAMRVQQLAAVKEIRVFGFKDITDSLISIYNEFGIKAVASFDAKAVFTYELAIPLSSLNLSASKPKEFAYNIRVNGLQTGAEGFGGNRNGGGSGRSFGGGNGGGGRNGGGGNGSARGGLDFADLMSPTDFWGKYTLAIK